MRDETKIIRCRPYKCALCRSMVKTVPCMACHIRGLKLRDKIPPLPEFAEPTPDHDDISEAEIESRKPPRRRVIYLDKPLAKWEYNSVHLPSEQDIQAMEEW